MELTDDIIRDLINRPHSIFCTCFQCEEERRAFMLKQLEEVLGGRKLIITNVDKEDGF